GSRLRVPRPHLRRGDRREDRRRLPDLSGCRAPADRPHRRRHDRDGRHVAADRQHVPEAVRARDRRTMGTGGHGREARVMKLLGVIPFLLIVAAWAAASVFVQFPSYVLPTLNDVISNVAGSIADGSLVAQVAASLVRLAIGFLIGNLLAIPIGFAI